MTKDKALEELFLSSRPHFEDKEAFMANLTKRLDAVEFIRQHQEATIRRYKMAMMMAFIVGILSGAVAMCIILSTPAEVPLFTFKIQTGLLLWLSENSRFITAIVLALVMSFGLMSIINNVYDIIRMREKQSVQGTLTY